MPRHSLKAQAPAPPPLATATKEILELKDQIITVERRVSDVTKCKCTFVVESSV